MKKILISLVLAVLALSWSSSVVLAQGKGRGGQGRQVKSDAPDKGRPSKEDVSADKNKGKPAEAQVAAQKGKDRAAEKGADKGKAKGPAVEKVAGGDKGKPAEKGIGKGHQQQLTALRKQTANEQAKHLRRRARLERIRQLAADAGEADVLARVNKLIDKEQERYDRRRKTMREQEQRILQLGEKGLSDSTLPVAGKAKTTQNAEKGKGKAAKDKKGTEKPSEE